jgi:hypothetical protein
MSSLTVLQSLSPVPGVEHLRHAVRSGTPALEPRGAAAAASAPAVNALDSSLALARLVPERVERARDAHSRGLRAERTRCSGRVARALASPGQRRPRRARPEDHARLACLLEEPPSPRALEPASKLRRASCRQPRWHERLPAVAVQRW